MSENLINFKNYLKKMFRKEDSNFNWGVYRIINQCNKEIDDFVDNQIPLIIKSQIKEKSQLSLKEIDNQIEDLIIKCTETGTDYKTSEKYKNLMSQKEKFGTKDLDISIYDNLLNFFTRYYQDGDFISRHYYSDGLKQEYMIPYDGSETYLYWPTKDQYYIKSSDQYKRFSFELGKINVAFIVTQADQEKNNVKEKGKKFFSLALENPFEWNENKTELIVKFTHEIAENPESDLQKKYNVESIKKINQFLEESKIKDKLEELNENNENKHTIVKFQKRYTEDFFIHKNLKSFLEFELENYITQEILNTGNLLNSTDLEINKNKILEAKITKQIAEKIIEQLATIEDLKKKIWEKKKFVLETNYVITLDIIGRYLSEKDQNLFLETIIKNSDQLKEWNILFNENIRKVADLFKSNQATLNQKKQDLKSLPVDTRYFNLIQKQNLINQLCKSPDFYIDEKLNGVAIYSENWQALNTLSTKYNKKIQLIYIDPPFNLGNNGDFLYKTDYLDSSWCSMLLDRIILSEKLLSDKGVFTLNCDDNGNMFVKLILDNVFPISINEIVNCYEKPGGNDRCLKNNHTTIFANSLTPNYKFNNLLLPKKEYNDYKIAKSAIESFTKFNKLNIDISKYLQDIEPTCGQYSKDPFYKFSSDWWSDIASFATAQTAGERTSKMLNINFNTQQREELLRRFIAMFSDEQDFILDYYLGSATTIAAAQKMKRCWIGIEMGPQFYSIDLQRLKMILNYDKSGISNNDDIKENYSENNCGGFFKYQTLEQYEDALENIEFKQTQLSLSSDILLKYKLDVLSKDSKTFFGVNPNEDFEDFKIYTLNDKLEKVPTKVDLVETFNYLIGLWVDKYIIKENLKDDNRKYICIKGKVDNDPVFVIWRNLKDIDLKKDKDFIEEELIVGQKYSQLFVNSDCAISGFKETYTEFRDKLWD